MPRDAMSLLELPHDPTLRITMSEERGQPDAANAPSGRSDAISQAMWTDYPAAPRAGVLLASQCSALLHASAYTGKNRSRTGDLQFGNAPDHPISNHTCQCFLTLSCLVASQDVACRRTGCGVRGGVAIRL